MLFIANLIMVLSAMCGMLLIAHRNRMGFVVYFITEITFFYIGYASSNYGLCIAGVLYFSINVYSFIQWGKK